MKTRVYKSLDRSVQFFGIKGRFLLPVGIGAGVSLAIGFLVAKVTMGLIGLLMFFLLFFSCIITAITIQGSISEKELFTKIAMSRCPECIRVKPQRLKRLWR